VAGVKSKYPQIGFKITSEADMTRKILMLVIAGSLVHGMALMGHHSIGATYDGKKEVKLDGKLVQFLFRNPHSFVHVEAPDESGKMQRWAVEWGGAGALGSQGVTRDTLKVGDEVVITGNPSRTAGDHRVKMNTLHRKKDGFGWGTRPGEVVD
jgi:hypothetical protein